MKKFLAFLMMAALIMTAFYSCKDDDDDDDNEVKASLIKTINFSADWNRAVSGYEFFYNANGLVTNFNRTMPVSRMVPLCMITQQPVNSRSPRMVMSTTRMTSIPET